MTQVDRVVICLSTVENLGLRAYEVQLMQKLKPDNHPRRRRFAGWVQEVYEFHKTTIFFGNIHF